MFEYGKPARCLTLQLRSDYLKFSLPLSYSLTTIAWGAIQWFDGYQKANQVGYLKDMIKWGTDWVIQAHPDANTFYVQVGDGNIDNNYWGKVVLLFIYACNYF